MPDMLTRPEGSIEDAELIVKGMRDMYKRAAKNGIDEKARKLAKDRAAALDMAMYALERVAMEDWIKAEKEWIREMEKELEG